MKTGRELAMQEMIELVGDKEFILVQEGLRKSEYGPEVVFQCNVFCNYINASAPTYREAVDKWKAEREEERQRAIRKLQEMAA